jgi:hypothetical protein
MRGLRSGIIQNLEIDEKLIGTDFKCLAALVTPYIINNNIPYGGIKGIL